MRQSRSEVTYEDSEWYLAEAQGAFALVRTGLDTGPARSGESLRILLTFERHGDGLVALEAPFSY